MIQNNRQECFFYPHQNHPYYIHPSMPPHPICLCPYWTSYQIYAPYGVLHYPHIPSFGYLYRLPQSYIPSSVSKKLFPPDLRPHSSSRMTREGGSTCAVIQGTGGGGGGYLIQRNIRSRPLVTVSLGWSVFYQDPPPPPRRLSSNTSGTVRERDPRHQGAWAARVGGGQPGIV